MNKLLLLLLCVSFEAWASCPADEDDFKHSLDIKKISSIRAAYDIHADYYQILECYFRILHREAEVAILNNEFKITENAANEMLRMEPQNSWAMLFMQIALRGQTKKVPAWYANDKMPERSSNEAFIKYLSSQLTMAHANNTTSSDTAR